jgi:hypothetical protein
MIHTPTMDTSEYKELYANARLAYPQMDDYFVQVACLAYLKDQGIKCDNSIEAINEVQEECPA